MREGRTDSLFYTEESTGVFHGVILGYDYCAEHEWGIQGILDSFGVNYKDESCLGIESRRFTKVPKNLRLIKNKYKGTICHHLIFPRHSWNHREESEIDPVGYLSKDNDFSTAWDGNSWGISVLGARNPKIELLKELYYAIIRLDVALIFVNKKGSTNPFSRTSPFLGIVSKMDKDFLDSTYQYDLDKHLLKKASDNTGIESYLKEKDKKYYGLKPSWASSVKETNDGRTINTKYEVIYFLNPIDQKYKAGWYTVEDLLLWGNDVGPVPKEVLEKSKDFILREG